MTRNRAFIDDNNLFNAGQRPVGSPFWTLVSPVIHAEGVATLPDGTKRWLLWIKDWDFSWQDQYQYKVPVILPKGTRIEMTAHYDNSENNPFNPNPNIEVRYGPQSTDEMVVSFIGFVIDVKADPTKLFPRRGRGAVTPIE